MSKQALLYLGAQPDQSVVDSGRWLRALSEWKANRCLVFEAMGRRRAEEKNRINEKRRKKVERTPQEHLLEGVKSSGPSGIVQGMDNVLTIPQTPTPSPTQH